MKTASENARKALQLARDNPNALNTLTAIQAELGELGDARRNMLASIEVKGDLRPDEADLYVQARILEQLGLTSDAIALYRQLETDSPGRFIPDPYDLARRRLQALGVKK